MPRVTHHQPPALPERLMLAWGPVLPVRGRISTPWWRTAVVLAAAGDRLGEALEKDRPVAQLLEALEQPPAAGMWVWQGFPVERQGGALLDLSDGTWRRPVAEEWRGVQRPARWHALDEPLRLLPCVYSAHQSVAEIRRALELYPAQCCHTREAVEGWAIELRFEARPGGPVGTLSEILAATYAISTTIVACDGEVDASLGPNGWAVDGVRFALGARGEAA